MTDILLSQYCLSLPGRLIYSSNAPAHILSVQSIRHAPGLTLISYPFNQPLRLTVEELSVLAHEVAHEMLHKDRDNMPKDKKIRETEAEAVSFVVCHGIGLDTNSASSDYIQLYNGDKETLMESLGRIQKTASEILEAVMDKDSGCETAGEGSRMAVVA